MAKENVRVYIQSPSGCETNPVEPVNYYTQLFCSVWQPLEHPGDRLSGISSIQEAMQAASDAVSIVNGEFKDADKAAAKTMSWRGAQCKRNLVGMLGRLVE